MNARVLRRCLRVSTENGVRSVFFSFSEAYPSAVHHISDSNSDRVKSGQKLIIPPKKVNNIDQYWSSHTIDGRRALHLDVRFSTSEARRLNSDIRCTSAARVLNSGTWCTIPVIPVLKTCNIIRKQLWQHCELSKPRGARHDIMDFSALVIWIHIIVSGGGGTSHSLFDSDAKIVCTLI